MRALCLVLGVSVLVLAEESVYLLVSPAMVLVNYICDS